MPTKFALQLRMEMTLHICPLKELFHHFDSINQIINFLVDKQLSFLGRKLVLLYWLHHFVDTSSSLLLSIVDETTLANAM